ncbi:hypothetical protein ACQPZP_06545 [Spirillospora sp. CA-142024]|uniref:hypothetical protein n=1 Tax=Spirillospora sp. CA-142024 TaxID=3240036 RepID=UPI003D9478FB
MIRNSRRVVVLAMAGAVAIAPVISGCGAGEQPQSARPTQLTEGVNVTLPKSPPSAAQIDLRHMFLLGPEPGQPIPAGTSMALYGVVINQVKGRQDRLVSVTSPAFGDKAKLDGGIVLPPAAPDGTGSFTRLLGTPSATPSPTPPAKKTRQPATRATPKPTGVGATPKLSETPTSSNTATPPQSTPPATPATPGGEQPLVVLPGLAEELNPGAAVPVTMQFEKAGSVEFRVPVVSRQGEYATYPLPSTPTPTPQSPGAQTPGAQTPGSETPGGTATSTPTPGAEPGGAEPSPTTTETPTAGH